MWCIGAGMPSTDRVMILRSTAGRFLKLGA
jgi:hypothetical protein